MLSELVTEVAEKWPAYHSGKRTDKEARVHKLIVNEIPNLLMGWLEKDPMYMCTGSDGQGNLLQAPWFAVFNRNITESAQRGYYVVFLFSEDMSTLTLEIGFGATQFKEKFGTGKEFFAQLDLAVVNMRSNSEHLSKEHLNFSFSRTNKKDVKLDLNGNFNLKSYEKCAIYSIVYEISNLTDEILRKDFEEYINLYDAMVESLLLADVDDYVFEQLVVPPQNLETKVTDFQPRVRKVKRTKKEGRNANTNYRRSKKSDKIGKLGEEWVFNFEKRKLIESGNNLLADKVIWHREYPENRTPGWDITSYDEDGKLKYIEVKSSEGKVINDFVLTSQEWEKARSEIAPDYFIYLVTDLAKNPNLEIIRNPSEYVLSGKLDLEIESYSLSLYQKD